ncbi:hypothetical protein [Pimelobacter simplex]|uniref:hypothetical protein n=1 Tax=Nocardioides simplex TaxID=2045 RepID=UPI003AAAA832
MSTTSTTDWKDGIPAAILQLGRGYEALLHANRSLPRAGYADPGYAPRLEVIDAALLLLLRARWQYNRATGENAERSIRTFAAADIEAARVDAEAATELASAVAGASGPVPADVLDRARAIAGELRSNGTEIGWLGDVPIVPSIAPVVVLAGSSREMGRQYADQSLEIFGPFVFEALAKRPMPDDVVEVIGGWAEQLERHAPEILEFARGIAEGVTASGMPMSDWQAISLVTDVSPPATEPLPIGVLDAEGGGMMGAYFGTFLESELASQTEGPCSGAAAWGSATVDGRAHFASSTDHDCDFQVTIVAFPDDGHAFIHTPFSVNGSIAGVGRFGLAGHPAFNAAGVAYVHHGGGNSCTEPRDTWGYGVTRGAAVMHVMRYADSAEQAIEMDLALPVGNAGRLLGSGGGFYLDDRSAGVIEDRTPGGAVVRTQSATTTGERHDFLYATNNLQSPEHSADVFCAPEGGYDYGVETGWYTEQPGLPEDVGGGASTRQLWASSSAPRNRELHRRLVAGAGKIDAAALRDLFSVPGEDGAAKTPPEAPVGHRGNAFVAFGTPSLGRYSGAVGMLAPRWTGSNFGHGFYYHGETGTHWDLDLGPDPAAVLDAARTTAERDVERAARLLDEVRDRVDAASLDRLLDAARDELTDAAQGLDAEATAIDVIARSCRGFTRAQVRARQVLAAVESPEAS